MISKLNYCDSKCCNYKVIPYDKKVPFDINKNKDMKIKKAGSFIYDSFSKKVLLVQSRGQMWGCPKGTLKDYENPLDCAIREVKEETGIDIEEKELSDYIIMNSKVQYYLFEMKENNVYIQNHIEDNDANGIGWFNIHCLEILVYKGIININQQCRMLIKKVFSKDIPFNKDTKKRLIT
jgi:hypothetical protein